MSGSVLSRHATNLASQMAPALKRCFDVLASSVALLLLSPLMLVIALCVLVDSPGPVLFMQVRVGRDGRPFTIHKFRTMAVGSERTGVNVSPLGDSRVTRVGRFLRRWYVDEWPQFFDVLLGRMSLVGPRPETPEFVSLYSPQERRVLAVRPGIVGPSTLLCMDEERRLAEAPDALELYVSRIMHDRVAADLRYLERWSLLSDLQILARQCRAIVRRS